MRVWNVNAERVEIVTRELRMRTNRLDEDSVATNVTLRPETSSSLYSRRAFTTNRRGPWLCWHGFEDFIRVMFAVGATRVKSSMGDWRSLDEFEMDLDRLGNINVGSIMYPAYLGDSPCECAI